MLGTPILARDLQSSGLAVLRGDLNNTNAYIALECPT